MYQQQNMTERPQLRLVSLLPSLSALLVINASNAYQGFFALRERVHELTANWDALAALLAIGCLYVAALGITGFYGRYVLLRPGVAYHLAWIAVAIDFYWLHRPLAVYLAAIVIAVRIYRSGEHRVRHWVLLGSLAFGLVPI